MAITMKLVPITTDITVTKTIMTAITVIRTTRMSIPAIDVYGLTPASFYTRIMMADPLGHHFFWRSPFNGLTMARNNPSPSAASIFPRIRNLTPPNARMNKVAIKLRLNLFLKT